MTIFSHNKQTAKRGFTLIEMMVSTAIFAVVMVIALGALLAMSESDRKAQTIKSVVNNLNFSLDSMSRAIRTGTDFNCGSQSGGDCDGQGSPNGSDYFAFVDSNGNSVAYCLSGTSLMREVVPNGGSLDISCGAAGFAPVTAPEVVITNLMFYLVGASRTDNIEPKLTILLAGYVQVNGAATASSCTGNVSNGTATCFNLQSTVTQRLYDR